MKYPGESLANSVLKVDGGRGFVVQYRVKHPPIYISAIPEPLRFRDYRAVITAAHCLPELPPAHAAAFRHERTYDLLGSLKGGPLISAECLFVDPVADIAVLGRPDYEEHEEQADLYDELVAAATPLHISEPRSGTGFVLSLEGRWTQTVLELDRSTSGTSLKCGPTQPGMSGSPILNADWSAIGVVSIGAPIQPVDGTREDTGTVGPQPILTHDLPGWLLRGQSRARRALRD